MAVVRLGRVLRARNGQTISRGPAHRAVLDETGVIGRDELRAAGVLGWAPPLQGRTRGRRLIRGPLDHHVSCGKFACARNCSAAAHWADLGRGSGVGAAGSACAEGLFGDRRPPLARPDRHGLGQARIAQGIYDERRRVFAAHA